MEYRESKFEGKRGYDVLKDGKFAGFVYKTIDSPAEGFWKHNESGREFHTRREATEDLMKVLEQCGI